MEGGEFPAGRAVAVTQAEFLAEAFFGARAGGVAGRVGRRSAAVDAAEDGVLRVEFVGEAESAHGHLAVDRRVGAAGRGVGHVEEFVTHARPQGQRAELDRVFDEERRREGLLEAGRSHRGLGARADHAVVDRVGRALVRAAGGVAVDAQAGHELMAYFAGLELLPHRALPAVGLVIARGVVGEERAVVAGDEVAAQDREGRGVREGFGDVGAEAGAGQAVELIPGAVELVVVQRALEAEGLVRFGDPLHVGAPVFGDVVVETARAVAAVRIRAEVGLGQARVGFIGFEVGLADLEFDALAERALRFPGQLDHRFGEGETAAAADAVDRAVTVAELGVQFDERADLPGFGHRRAAEPGLVEEVAVVAGREAREEALAAGRDGRREEVDDTTRGVRAVHHLARALEELDAGHASRLRSVIGVRRRVGRGRGQDAVLHQGDLGATRAVDAADRDVGEVAEAVFIAHEHPRGVGGDLLDVRVALGAELVAFDDGRGAREDEGIRGDTRHGQGGELAGLHGRRRGLGQGDLAGGEQEEQV